jgi:hypothetical protein
MSTYNSQYFIDKLVHIPKDNWLTVLTSNFNNTKHCTIGWLGGWNSEQTLALGKIFTKHFAIQIDEPEVFEELRECPATIVYMVNDGNDCWGLKLKGSHPKERILNALYQIRKKELQDGNVALVKKIVAKPLIRTDENETAPRRKLQRVSADY